MEKRFDVRSRLLGAALLVFALQGALHSTLLWDAEPAHFPDSAEYCHARDLLLSRDFARFSSYVRGPLFPIIRGCSELSGIPLPIIAIAFNVAAISVAAVLFFRVSVWVGVFTSLMSSLFMLSNAMVSFTTTVLTESILLGCCAYLLASCYFYTRMSDRP